MDKPMTNNPTPDPIQADAINAAIDVLEKAAQMIVSEMELSGENEEYRLRKVSFIFAEIERLHQFQRTMRDDKIVIDRAAEIPGYVHLTNFGEYLFKSKEEAVAKQKEWGGLVFPLYADTKSAVAKRMEG